MAVEPLPQGSSPSASIRRSFSSRTASRLSRDSSAITRPSFSSTIVHFGQLEPNCSRLRHFGQRQPCRSRPLASRRRPAEYAVIPPPIWPSLAMIHHPELNPAETIEVTGLELFMTEIKVADWPGMVAGTSRPWAARWSSTTRSTSTRSWRRDGRLALKGGGRDGLDRDRVRLVFQVAGRGRRAGAARSAWARRRPARRERARGLPRDPAARPRGDADHACFPGNRPRRVRPERLADVARPRSDLDAIANPSDV